MESSNFQQFQRGNSRSLNYYFDSYVKELLIFCYRIVYDNQVAEEIVQDTFTTLWNSRSSIQSEEHLKSFLYHITRNKSIDYLRSNKSNPIVSTDSIPEDIMQADPNLLARMIHAETLDLIYKEVKNLTTTQRQIFEMTFIEGLSAQEISEKLSMSPNAVYTARSKALAMIRLVCQQKDFLIFIAFLQIADTQLKSRF